MSKAIFRSNDGRDIPIGRPVIKAGDTMLFDCGHEIKRWAIEAAGLVLCAICDNARVSWRRAIRDWVALPPLVIPHSNVPRTPDLIALKFWEMQ